MKKITDNQSITDTQSNPVNITIRVEGEIYKMFSNKAKENGQSLRRMASEAILWWVMKGAEDAEAELEAADSMIRDFWKTALGNRKQTETDKMTRNKWHRRFPGVPYPTRQDAPGDVQIELGI